MATLNIAASRTLGEKVRFAAECLPDNYEINLGIERNAGWVDLLYESRSIEYPSNHETLEKSFHDALYFAIAHPHGDEVEIAARREDRDEQ